MDYSKLTDEKYDKILGDIVKENSSTLLTIPGAYEVFSEHFNNEVLDRWAQTQSEDDKGA